MINRRRKKAETGGRDRRASRASATRGEAVPARKGCVYTGNIYINSPFFIVPHDRIIIFCQYIFCVLTSYFHTLPCNKPIQRQNAQVRLMDGPAPSQPVHQTTGKGVVCNRSLCGSLRRPQGSPSETTTTRGTPSAPLPDAPVCVRDES